MKKSVKIIIVSAIGVAVCVGGYFGYKKYKASKKVSTGNSYYAVTAKKMNLSVSVQGTGSVAAGTSKDIIAGNNGTLQDLSLNAGDKVAKGQKICTVYSDQLDQSVDSAQSKVNQINLQISQAKPGQDTSSLNLQLQDAQNSLNSAIKERDAATIYSPIDGIVLTEDSANGDSIQSGKTMLTVVDPSSYQVTVSVDELDINKVKAGQKAQITFGAITGKTYDGVVKTISSSGTVSNNVTTYDVVVSISNLDDSIKLGMTANVNIEVENKENVVAIPLEALIERNGKKYVMESNGSAASSSTSQNNSSANTSQSGNSSANTNGSSNTNSSKRRSGSTNYGNSQSGNSQGSGSGSNSAGQFGQTYYSGKLVEIQTGIQNDNYIEVTSGLNDGDKVLVEIPKVSTTNTNQKSSFGSMMGGGGFGGSRTSGSGSSKSSSGNSSTKNSTGSEANNSTGNSSNGNSNSSGNSGSGASGNTSGGK